MDRLETFNQHRSLLFAIAYRMLGTVTDAEDMVQDTCISTYTVRNPDKLRQAGQRAFLMGYAECSIF